MYGVFYGALASVSDCGLWIAQCVSSLGGQGLHVLLICSAALHHLHGFALVAAMLHHHHTDNDKDIQCIYYTQRRNTPEPHPDPLSNFKMMRPTGYWWWYKRISFHFDIISNHPPLTDWCKMCWCYILTSVYWREIAAFLRNQMNIPNWNCQYIPLYENLSGLATFSIDFFILKALLGMMMMVMMVMVMMN